MRGMFVLVVLACASTLADPPVPGAARSSTLLEVLDSMTGVMEGPGRVFSRYQFLNLQRSMAMLDSNLPEAQVHRLPRSYLCLPGAGLAGVAGVRRQRRREGGCVGQHTDRVSTSFRFAKTAKKNLCQ